MKSPFNPTESQRARRAFPVSAGGGWLAAMLGTMVWVLAWAGGGVIEIRASDEPPAKPLPAHPPPRPAKTPKAVSVPSVLPATSPETPAPVPAAASAGGATEEHGPAQATATKPVPADAHAVPANPASARAVPAPPPPAGRAAERAAGTPSAQVHGPPEVASFKPVAGGVERTLEHSRMLFASTNLLADDSDRRKARAREEANAEFERMLETGRRLRTSGLHEEAVPNLAAILTRGAPEEFQKAALVELALSAQDQNQLSRALQVYAQFLSRWPQDASSPEILLRQGLIYRQLGLHQMATTKFYATMTAALTVKDELFDYYRRLVLQAQAEIAETLALQGMHAEAAGAFARLLKENSPNLNRARVHYRYLQALAAQGKHAETIGQARQFLAERAGADEEPEVRFMLATCLKKLNRNSESVREILNLLQMQQGQAREHPEVLAYWQQRTGNEIANQLYQEGDYLHALDVYESLLLLSDLTDWQCAVRYQIGLAYEKLEQPMKAADAYASIAARETDILAHGSPALKATLEMARWRRDFLRWQQSAEVRRRDVQTFLVSPEASVSGSSTNRL